MRGEAGQVERHNGRMADLQKFQRACRVFLARLLIVYGPAAPDLLQRHLSKGRPNWRLILSRSGGGAVTTSN
jgi:hypothetical protein